MKQTAVEWLHQISLYRELDKFDFEQAKKIEKEQMEKAVSKGISSADMTNNRGYFDFDKYYNEAYGNKS